MKRGSFAVACLLVLAPAAAAQGAPDEDSALWRIGLAAHNIRIHVGEFQSHENGPNLELEAASARLQELSWLGRPRFYGELSGNLNGDTSFAATGLSWEWRFAPGWRIEPGFGIAIHDGSLRNPFPASDPRGVDYQHDHQLLGTRMLFRDSLALECDVGGGHSIGLVLEHLSNGGNLFGHSDNESLNELGLRYSTHFR